MKCSTTTIQLKRMPSQTAEQKARSRFEKGNR
uniref:Uncharacterized protein n=1 Tax=Rhizophora mucronata TaxID=61149 RepID=A0A2P2P5P4_RHIMU